MFLSRRNAPPASEKSTEDPQSFEEVKENQAKAEDLEDYADKLDKEAKMLLKRLDPTGLY